MVKCLIYIYFVNFHVCKWKNAYKIIKYLNALRVLVDFLCIYLGEGKGEGVALMPVYVLSAFTTEPLNWCLRNFIGMKYSWSAHALRCFDHIFPRADLGQGKNRSWGGPRLRKRSHVFRNCSYMKLMSFCCLTKIHCSNSKMTPISLRNT